MADNINPAHYKQGGIECIDAIAAAIVNLAGNDAMCTGNAIKYLWRWKQKNGVEDLRKAKWYIDRLIAENLDAPIGWGAISDARENVTSLMRDREGRIAHGGVLE